MVQPVKWGRRKSARSELSYNNEKAQTKKHILHSCLLNSVQSGSNKDVPNRFMKVGDLHTEKCCFIKNTSIRPHLDYVRAHFQFIWNCRADYNPFFFNFWNTFFKWTCKFPNFVLSNLLTLIIWLCNSQQMIQKLLISSTEFSSFHFLLYNIEQLHFQIKYNLIVAGRCFV